MTEPHKTTKKFYAFVLAFDPGASTGYAALDERGLVVNSATFDIKELEKFLEEIRSVSWNIVVEVGPSYQHHSPVTRSAERLILDTFPNALRISPSRWKSHPAPRRNMNINRLKTQHERDAARLGRWYQVTIGEKRVSKRRSTAQDAASAGHQYQ